MTEIYLDPTANWAISCFLGLIFVSAGYHKATNPAYYRSLITQHIPDARSAPVILLPVLTAVELIVGVCLLVPTVRPVAAIAVTAILILYFAVIAISLIRGLDVDCGCSGPLESTKMSPWLLFRNGVLILMSTLLLIPVVDRPFHFVDALFVFAEAVCFCLLYVSFEQIMLNTEKSVAVKTL